MTIEVEMWVVLLILMMLPWEAEVFIALDRGWAVRALFCGLVSGALAMAAVWAA